MEKKNKKWKSAAFEAACIVFGIIVSAFAYSEHEKRIKAEARADANEKIIKEQTREQTKRLAQQSYYNGKYSK